MNSNIQKIIDEFRFGVISKENNNYILRKSFEDGGVLNKQIQNIFQRWLNSSTIHYSSLYNNFMELIKDLDQMYFSNVFISRAIQMSIDEVLQISNNGSYFIVDGSSSVRNEIWKLFKSININKITESIVKTLIKYGNAYLVLTISDNGIEDANPVPVSAVKERLEFTPYDIQYNLPKTMRYSLISVHQKWDLLIHNILQNSDINDKFRNYLLGFVVLDDVLPPWRVIHFRNEDTDNPFYPFGLPFYMNSIAPYKHYWTAVMMQMLARSTKFPRQIFKLKMPPNTPTTTALSRAVQFMNQIDALGLANTNKEGFGLNERVITIDEIYTFEEEVPDMGNIRVDDIELLRDDVVLSTNIPRNFLDPNNGSFGNSGIALKQQFIPFARFVFQVQSIVLQGILQLVKTHLILSGKYEDNNFSIQMIYPESMYNSEILSSYRELLGFANEFLEALASKLGVNPDEGLPPEIVYMVYSKFVPYIDLKTLEDWFVKIISHKNVSSQGQGEGSEEDFGFGGGGFGGGEEFGGGEFNTETGEMEMGSGEGGEEILSSRDRERKRMIKEAKNRKKENEMSFEEILEKNANDYTKRLMKEAYISLNQYLMNKEKNKLLESVGKSKNKNFLKEAKEEIEHNFYAFLSEKGVQEYYIAGRHVILPTYKDKHFDPEVLINIKKEGLKLFKENKENNKENNKEKKYLTKGFNIYSTLKEWVEYEE
jgi:hypothetical protein